MKFFKITFFILFVVTSSLSGDILAQSNPPVYMTLVSHNEDNSPWTTYNFYKPKRDLLVQIADIVQSKGAVWSFQSDWKFLLGVIQFDTGSVVSNTNGKNLIRWMVEDKGVICDPHSHEANGYNYADVAYLHQQLGITPTKVVGGFLYDTVINGNNWENLENGIYGRVYTSYFWKPDILWGSGTPLHVNDPYPLGAWKPQSMANYYYHDSSKHLVVLGHGCENQIEDTSNITYNTETIRNIVNQLNSGGLPDTGFYPAFSIFSVGDLNASRVTKISQFIDSIAPMINQGRVIWKSLTDIYTIWNTTYEKKPFWVMCDDIPVSVQQISTTVPNGYGLSQNYPNPFNPDTNIELKIPRRTFAELKIFDVTGKLIDILLSMELQPGIYSVDWNAVKYSSGIYFYSLVTSEFTETKKMVLIK
ncbi:MAG: T9SS type A sorting domain-containing protein [Ignavibacteria bacterium]|nr:T9SS type A sorting domain-containing protein [Ignavibacteria bacterium]MCC7159654.1 T9SS type A sorting domain-containing protein [Ignavibacteria bacterium]